MKRTLIAGYITLTLACTSGGAARSIPRPANTPLAFMAGRQVIVLPVQRSISFPDPSSQPQPALVTQFLAALDDSITAAFGQRGLNSWTFAQEISAVARRNTGMLPDPHVLAASGLRRLVKASDDPLNEPLASQIRSLVSMREGRYVILPAALEVENTAGGLRATVFVYLIDARTARIQWSGAVTSDVSRALSATLAGNIAQHVADLVMAR